MWTIKNLKEHKVRLCPTFSELFEFENSLVVELTRTKVVCRVGDMENTHAVFSREGYIDFPICDVEVISKGIVKAKLDWSRTLIDEEHINSREAYFKYFMEAIDYRATSWNYEAHADIAFYLNKSNMRLETEEVKEDSVDVQTDVPETPALYEHIKTLLTSFEANGLEVKDVESVVSKSAGMITITYTKEVA